MKLLPRIFLNDYAFDVGTMNTVVYTQEQGVILQEPSVVALRHQSTPYHHHNAKEILAVGQEARSMTGRTPEGISVIRPLREGVIADFYVAEKMLQYFIRRVHKKGILRRNPRILISVPCCSTQVERRAIRESALGAGAREVYLVTEPIAAALGAGLPIDKPHGYMVVDIGGGTTEIAILSLNGMVCATSVKIGGDKFDEAIVQYVRRMHGNIIGETTAEQVKQKIGSAYPTGEIVTLEVHGRNIAEGSPRSFQLNSNSVLEALQEPLTAIVTAVKQVLEKAPPELAGNLLDHGIILTGGGSLLKNLDILLSTETGLPVRVTDDPITCVARGGGRALDLITKRHTQFLIRD